MTTKKAKYTPIGESLDLGTTFIQAANALDVAAVYAVESRDATQLTKIAQAWIEMGRSLGMPGGDDDDEMMDEEDVTSSHPLGFESNAQTELRKRERSERTES